MSEGKSRPNKLRKLKRKCPINEIGRKPLKKKKNGNRSRTSVNEGGKECVNLSTNVEGSGKRMKDNLSKPHNLVMKVAKRHKNLRKRGKKSKKGEKLCSANVLPAENECTKPSQKSVTKIEKVSTGISIRNPLKKKKNRKGYQAFINKGEKLCVGSDKNVEGHGKRIKDNLSESSTLVTKVTGQCTKVRLRSKKRRKSKNENNKSGQTVESSKKTCTNLEPFKQLSKRKSYDSQEGNVETKRRRIESNNSCWGSGKQRGNHSLQSISPAKKQSINLPSNGHSIEALSGNGQNKIIKFEDNGELSSAKNYKNSRKQPRDVHNTFCSETLSEKKHNKRSKFEDNRELTFTKNFNHNISKKESICSPSNGHSIQTGNRLNKIIKFEDNGDFKPPSSKKFNDIDSNKQKRNINRNKHSNKMQPELENKKKKVIKPEKEIASSIKGKNDEKQVDNDSSEEVVLSPKTKTTKDACLSLRERMLSQLKSSRFRYLNQQLYTSDSNEANVLFQKDPDLFKNYHEGFKRQVEQWPINPIDRIIKGILRRPADLVLADFGCGDAKLAKSVPNKVHSFDLIALSDEVTVCDMANTPLKDASVDICVFCLSLMGTNLESFIIEANRVLKLSGVLKIAEVASRFEKVETFINDLKKYGFAFANKDFSHNLFYFMNFTKSSNITKPKDLPPLQLNPCMYKKR